MGGECSTLPPDIFFPELYDDDAPVVVPSDVKALCARCPFFDGCLAWALDNDAYGFWAATSRYQRLQLGRERHRVKCPGCSSTSVMVNGRSEVCMACGISWNV